MKSRRENGKRKERKRKSKKCFLAHPCFEQPKLKKCLLVWRKNHSLEFNDVINPNLGEIR